MARIRGHYEWEDDDLTPGQKREGGLHQNLYDREGKLKGNARFVPDLSDEPVVVTETVYLTIEERRRTPEDEALEEAVRKLVLLGLHYGIAVARPAVERWWAETARPALEARRTSRRERRSRRASRKHAVEAKGVGDSSRGVENLDPDRPAMSRAEAQARYLAALAARAYSDEQMRLIAAAEIVDSGDAAALRSSLAELPADQVADLVTTMATDPRMLADDQLAQLASTLAHATLEGPPRDVAHEA